jgi:hypothetical protein
VGHIRPRRASIVAVTCAAALGAGCSAWVRPQSERPSHRVWIDFTGGDIRPSVAQVEAGGQVVWNNDSTLYAGSVVFPTRVAERLGCRTTDTFHFTAAGYQSVALGGAVDELAWPCALERGDYDYEVRLFDSPPLSVPGDPESVLHGRIVVR